MANRRYPKGWPEPGCPFATAIEHIRTVTGEVRSVGRADPEVAHSLEDDLKSWTLTHLSVNGNSLALAALAVEMVDYPRWCA